MALEIKSLSKRIRDEWAYREISFSVGRGDLLGLLGSDDCGKKKILRAISGFDKPTSGEMLLDGVELTNGRKNGVQYPVSNRSSGWLGLFSGTNNENTVHIRRKTFTDALARLESVLLINNPTQGLDESDARQYSEELVTATRENDVCTVVATNNPEEIFRLCDRVAVMSGGRIIQIGTPEEVYSAPDNLEAAMLFGPNNIIAARRLTSNKKDIPEFFTVAGEHRISTGTVDKKMLGTINQTVRLSIRPEHISLSFGASFPGDNLLKARVTGVDFRGPTTTITLDASGLELHVVALRVVGLNEGDECMVGLPPDRIRIFPK